MIVLKITYDTSVVADFAPTFNSGYTYTTKTSTSDTLKTVTYESDTAFTTISLPNDNRSCVKSVYIDLSGVTNVYNLCVSCQEMTEFIAVNATNKLNNLGQSTFDCTKLTHITYENCDFSGVTNINNIFQTGARDAVTNATFKNVKFNNTSKSMISLLSKATAMVVEDCDFSSVTSFYNMFCNCVGLKGTLDLSMHDFANVYETNYMFYGCTNLTKIIMPKGTFDKITNCSYMFQDCKSLVKIDLSGFHIPNAQNISYMFSGCILIEEIDCSALGVLNPKNINHMFVSCQKLKRVNLSGIKVPTRTSFSHMFYDSTVVEWIDISNVITQYSDVTNFWRSGAVVNDIGMLYCPAGVINAFAKNMVNTGRTCNIYYHDAKLEDLTVDSRFNYIYCEEYHGDTVSTPDDLELHDLYYSYNNGHTMDTLDLTTGVCTKNISKFSDSTKLTVMDGSTDIGYFRILLKWDNLPNIVRRGNGTGIICNIMPVVYAEQGANGTQGVFAHGIGNYFVFYIYCNKTGVTTGAEAIQWMVDNGWEILYEQTSETVQLDINPLKSYRNGSITTSSQQLAPTLTTTLPISNKFTTTNLTSGSTYNVYFDGTATKLDAGGTIITNPVSPCEVECGGTTLTIEGTDIQNVRVIETSVKNEVGNICGTTDVELSKIITSDLEVITNDIEFSSASTDNGNINTVDNKLGTINTKGGHSWGAGYFTSNKTYPKGFSLLHIEFDVDMPSDNLMAIINFNNNVTNNLYNFRDLTLNNDTSTIAQGQQSVGSRYSSIVTKGHFSRLVYCFSSQGKINLNINTGSSAMLTASGNNAEGSTSGYTACANNGITISNFKIKVIENYPDATVSSQITSSLRTDSGLTVIWQDMDMSIGQSISTLEQPIKLRSLGTTYDSYNLVTGELTKRIGVSETDGSYSVLSSSIVSKPTYSKLYRNIFDVNGEVKNWTSTPTVNGNEMTFTGTWFTAVRVPKLITGKTYTLFYECVTGGRIQVLSDYTNQNSGFVDTGATWLPAGSKGVKTFIHGGGPSNGAVMFFANSSGTTYKNIMIVEGTFVNYEKLPYFEFGNELVLTYDNIKGGIPHLYTNGQVKVYSDSEVYPTTILNGQSTNNYEVNELNTSNNYTIRYDGECESINLANKSNTQGNNVLVKAGATSGNLTFVNDSGDIDNVLLTQGDVREQEINHFTGLETVEINQLFISSKQNLFEAYMKNDFEFLNDVYWGAQAYGSLHNGVFKCGNLSSGNNFQWGWNLLKPYVGGAYSVVDKGWLEEKPIILANKTYNISFNISIVDHHTVDGSHTYTLKAYDINGEEVTPQKATGGRVYLNTWSNGVTNPNSKKFINLDVIFSKDVYCFALQADYGGGWAFDCTITDLTICEPEYAKPDVPLVYEYIDLPQPVQLNSLLDGTHDTYNPITGEYVQNVGYVVYDDTTTWNSYAKDFYYTPRPSDFDAFSIFIPYHEKLDSTVASELWARNSGYAISSSVMMRVIGLQNKEEFLEYMKQYPLQMTYRREEPITTQLTPINIPTFEGGIVQLITTDGKVFPMVEYSMPTNNRYDTSSWETGAVYTQRNMTEAYFNESTTPMTPTETMTLTTDHISSGSIILNDNGNGLIVLKGNYTGRDIPYFTGMRSVEAIEVETTPSPDQPLFGKGGRK